MDFIRLCISRPVGVTVAVLLTVMFGLVGLTMIPQQLTPTVDRPIITVSTAWPGRSPQEIVDEITKEQEERLKSVGNLKSMRSTSNEGSAEITLEFILGADINRALQEVSDALRQVPGYPDEVDEPVIKAAEGASENAIAWMILDVAPDARARHADFDISTLHDALEREFKPFLERIDGVAEINVYGGREREVQVLIDPAALANRDLNIVQVARALQGENRNVSAGAIAEGKRDYRVRVVGRYQSTAGVLDTVVAYRDGKPVLVRDIATVQVDNQKKRGFVRSFGVPCIAINCIRQSNANVVDIMSQLRERLDEARADILPHIHPVVGPDLRLRQVYDETTYIKSAIRLVQTNLWVGGGIAAFVLLLFLRSIVATGVIALAIPVSVIGTFLFMLALGRSLNVISLAGLAFSVGMVVDNAIVVLENIDRRLKLGERPAQAAYRATREVWGAILASTLTTIFVFIPILTIEEEAGQLFRDIALAVVASVTLSFIVSVTVIPTACSRWLRDHSKEKHGRIRTAWETLFGLAPLAARLTRAAGDCIEWLSTGWRGWSLRPAVIVIITLAALGGSIALMPPLDYLPAGNRNLVFGGLLIPPGLSIEQQTDIAQRIERQIIAYAEADADDPASVASLAPVPRWPGQPPFEPVPIANFFIGAFGGSVFVGATSQREQVVIPVGQLLTNTMNTIPDAFGGASQTSIFGRGIAGGGTINLEVSGPNIERVLRAADFMFQRAGAEYSFGKVRPNPANFNLRQQEMQVTINQQGRELGLTTADVGTATRALFDGAFAGEYLLNGQSVDLMLLPKGGRLEYKEQLASIPIATPAGRTVPLDTVVDVVPALSPQAIQRIEELPSVTIQVTPPDDQALEQVMQTLRDKVIEPARNAGLVDTSMRIRLEGTAAQLDEVRSSLFGAAPGPGAAAPPWSRAVAAMSLLLTLTGFGVGAYCLWRAVRRRRRDFAYGAVGAALFGLSLASLLFVFGTHPEFMTARFIWALAVTYLLMAALFESFLYPLVIMFSVPLAVVGGFAGLAWVHAWSMADPTKAPQKLDVLTMLGFVILIGVVVNNAILLVHQALNFMSGADPDGNPIEPLTPGKAIAESVRVRLRPILMSTLTSVGGMLPLVLFPGAGSEMYRGLGSVVIGGLSTSAAFTLVVVPLLLGLVIQMKTGLSAALGRGVAATHRNRPPAAQLDLGTDQTPINGAASATPTAPPVPAEKPPTHTPAATGRARD